MIDAMNWISRFGVPTVLLMGVILLIMQGYRRRVWWVWPRLWIFIDGIVLSLTNISQLIVIFRGGYYAIGCHSSSKAVEGDYWLAIFSNWWQYFGSWGSSVAFAVISTNVMLVTMRPRWLNQVTPYLNGFNFMIIFGPPLVFLITTQALGLVGY